jgi:hypothetical protein
MARFHAFILSDATGAAYAFAATIMGGTFVGIVAIALAVSAAVSAL